MRRNYKAQVALEILTGRAQTDTGFKSKAMEAGVEREPMACDAYVALKQTFVDPVGLVLHPTLERAAASPDRLVGEDGLLQVKCPYPATHFDYLLGGEIPGEYQVQMQWEMACAERAWCDFVSYNPDFPVEHQLFVVRVPRDDKRIAEITAEVIVFLKEVDDLMARLNQRKA